MSIAPLRIFDFWATTDQPRHLGLLLTQAGIDPALVSDDGAERFLAHVGAVDPADTILNGPVPPTPELGHGDKVDQVIVVHETMKESIKVFCGFDKPSQAAMIDMVLFKKWLTVQ
ncbi:hypothetical protein OHC33_011267, partial [Knufia fluminis]